MPDTPDPLAPLPDMSSWNSMAMPVSGLASGMPTGMPGIGDANFSGMPTGDFSPAAGSGGVFGTGMSGLDFANSALGGLKTLGSLWGAWQGMKLAKKQFNFSRNFANANLANQTKAYNTTLADREGSRAVMEGLTPQQAQSYISSNSLSSPHL